MSWDLVEHVDGRSNLEPRRFRKNTDDGTLILQSSKTLGHSIYRCTKDSCRALAVCPRGDRPSKECMHIKRERSGSQGRRW